jgi:hypothetical protein
MTPNPELDKLRAKLEAMDAEIATTRAQYEASAIALMRLAFQRSELLKAIAALTLAREKD